MPIMGFLVTAAQWLLGFFVAQWVARKVFWISVLTVGLPWLLKDGLSYFWKVTEEYHKVVFQYVQGILDTALSLAGFDHTLNLYGVAGYIATQIGFLDYAAIVITAWGVCWTVKILGKIF